MDHDTLKEKLFTFYDRELTGEARREVEAHVANCSECRDAYAQWQQTASVLFRVPDVQTSDVFVHQVMGRLTASVRPRRAAPWLEMRWLIPVVGLAGLLLLMLSLAQHPVSLEALLLADGPENMPAQFVLASDTPSADDVLGLVMEGRP